MTSDHARRRSRSRSRGVESSAHLSYNGAMKVKPLLLTLSLFGLVVHVPGLAWGNDNTEWTKEEALQNLEKVSLKLRAEAESIEVAKSQLFRRKESGFHREGVRERSDEPRYKGGRLSYTDDEDVGPVLRGGLEAGQLLTGFGQFIALRELAEAGIDCGQAVQDGGQCSVA